MVTRWGGGNSVLIESKPEPHNYHRIGYTRLLENFTGATGLHMDAWWQHGRQRGKPNPGKPKEEASHG
jgi:hypothetical protein